MSNESLRSRWDRVRGSNSLAICIVYTTLMIDNMLLTAVVPILPEFFYDKHLHDEFLTESRTTMNSSAPPYLAENLNQTSNLSQQNTTVYTNNLNTDCVTSDADKYLLEENLYVGILFAAKPIVQLLANFIVGPICDRFGFGIPMFVGYAILIASATLFAFGGNYTVLILARGIQGIGSSCSSTAGLGMLAERYHDDEQRGKAIGLALGGLAMGVLIGAPFGSVVYTLFGKETVFLILAGLTLLVSIVQCFTTRLKISTKSKTLNVMSIWSLLRDPYVFVAACSITLANISIGVLETGQPIWMKTTMCAEKWELGVAFLPESFSYLVMTNIVAIFAQKLPRWLLAMIGFYVCVIGCITIPFANSLVELIGPGLLVGSAVGLCDSSFFPILANLVEIRHQNMFGSVFAIADNAFCFAFIISTLSAGGVISLIGFSKLMWIVAIIVFLYAPMILFLRNPPSQNEETQPILFHKSDENLHIDRSQNGSMVESP